MSEEIVVLVTTSSKAEAERIGTKLVTKNLIACANIVDAVQSIFRWEGEVRQEGEVLMVIKSVMSNLEEIVEEVKQSHSYDVPEIIALPIIGGSTEYLDWMRAETGGR